MTTLTLEAPALHRGVEGARLKVPDESQGKILGEFVCCLVCPLQQLGYIADVPQDRASDNFKCCHT